MKLQLTGTEEAIANIRKVAEAVGDEAMREMATEALQPVAEEARQLVRVDSGVTRDSITVEAELPGGEHSEYNGKAVFVGTLEANPFYAFFLEFGTIDMPPYPFLTPAVDAKEGEVFDILGKLAGEAILTAV